MSASPYKNVYEVDASTLDTGGTVVPTDLAEEVAAYSLAGNRDKTEWGIKILNGSDQPVEATPLISTSDDPELTEYEYLDAMAETAATGEVPANIVLLDSDVIGAYLAVELAPDAAATGTIKIVFQSRDWA